METTPAGRGNDDPRRWSPRIVVTGAAGFIGSHLVDTLLTDGHTVVGIDGFTASYDPAVKRANVAGACRHPSFTLIDGRLDEIGLEDLLLPGDVVFHLAAQAGVRPSWGEGFSTYTRDNIDATQRVLEAAHRCAVRRVVLASSSSVYGDAALPMTEDSHLSPVSPYGVTKLTTEHLANVYHRAHGLDVIPLRFFTVYGPRQRPDMAMHRFIDAVAAGRRVPVYGDGTQRRDFTFVGDVVRVLIAAAERGVPGRPVNVAGGSTSTVAAVVDLVQRLVGRRVGIDGQPSPPGDARDTEASTVRLRELCVPAQTGIDEGLRRQVDWQLGRTPRVAGIARPLRAHGWGRTVLLYSHDTYGLGHLRRNLAIAHALSRRDPRARIVLVSGSSAATSWRLPPRVSVVALPPAIKTGAEEYEPVASGTLRGLVARRSGLIASTLLRERPDAVLVDHAPLGMKGELRLALALAREELPGTRVVLGLRDVLDEASVVRASWAAQGVHAALREFYDDIAVYGCRDVYDVGEHYAMDAELRRRTVFTGYIAKNPAMEDGGDPQDGPGSWRDPGERRVLVLGGGGGDAEDVFDRTLAAWPSVHRVTGARALLVAGPLMDETRFRRLEARAAASPGDVAVLRFSRTLLSLIQAADVVVTMGGYNSLTEVVSSRRPAVVCPRVVPRREQLIRAEAFARHGLAHLHRLDAHDGADMTQTILRAWAEGPPADRSLASIDLGGLERVADLLIDAGAGATGRAVVA